MKPLTRNPFHKKYHLSSFTRLRGGFPLNELIIVSFIIGTIFVCGIVSLIYDTNTPLYIFFSFMGLFIIYGIIYGIIDDRAYSRNGDALSSDFIQYLTRAHEPGTHQELRLLKGKMERNARFPFDLKDDEEETLALFLNIDSSNHDSACELMLRLNRYSTKLLEAVLRFPVSQQNRYYFLNWLPPCGISDEESINIFHHYLADTQRPDSALLSEALLLSNSYSTQKESALAFLPVRKFLEKYRDVYSEEAVTKLDEHIAFWDE